MKGENLLKKLATLQGVNSHTFIIIIEEKYNKLIIKYNKIIITYNKIIIKYNKIITKSTERKRQMCAKCCRSVRDARDSTRVVRLRDQRGPDEDWLARRVRARKHLSLGKSYRWDARRAVPAWRLYLRSRSLDEQRRRGNGRMCHSSRTRHNNDRLETLTMPRGEYGRKGKKKKNGRQSTFSRKLSVSCNTDDRSCSLAPPLRRLCATWDRLFWITCCQYAHTCCSVSPSRPAQR